MKFGYFCNTTNWKHKPYNQLLDEAREISIFCDENNWDSIWFTEHHFNHEGMESCTNPLMMGTDIAARTKKIKIGQACNVITFHNPIRLAEDIAFSLGTLGTVTELRRIGFGQCNKKLISLDYSVIRTTKDLQKKILWDTLIYLLIQI